MARLNGNSTRLGALSPTRLADLRSCPRRVALLSQPQGRHRVPSSAASIGLVAHRALELLLSPPPAPDDDWVLSLRRAWTAAVNEAVDEGRGAWTPSPARRVLARLETVVLPALRTLLETIGPGVRIRCEVELAARRGLLVGRADAVIAGKAATAVVDWKTGLVREDGEARTSYVDQMRLYALMVEDAVGVWPSRAVLISLREGSVEVDVDRDVCEAIAHEALALLDAYDAVVPGRQPARPEPSVCVRCPVAAWCDSFWSTITPNWSTDPAWRGEALRGRVSSAPEHSAVGLSALRVIVEQGSLNPGETLVAGVPQPLAEALEPGAPVAAVGLLADARSGQLRVGDWGRLIIEKEGETPA